MMQPPPGFAWIEDSLCRASWSSGDAFSDSYLLFLKCNGVSSIMNVSGLDLDDQTLKFLSENNISLYEPLSHTRDPFEENVSAASSWTSTAVEQLITILGSNCVCLLGSERTHYDCVLVACLRRVQNWSLVSIISEFRLHSGPSRHFDLEQFIELFQPPSSGNLMPGKQGSVHLPEFLAIDHHIRDEEYKLLREYHIMRRNELQGSVTTTHNPPPEMNLPPLVVEDNEYDLSFAPAEISPVSASSHSPRDTGSVQSGGVPSSAALITMKQLLFAEGSKAISEGCTFDPSVSLIQDKEDDD